jgi:hypothetical protein
MLDTIIAQPGDKDVRFIRQMGPYVYTVNWGYRVIPNATTPEAEVSTLDKWILEKAGDKMYNTENKAVVLILLRKQRM